MGSFLKIDRDLSDGLNGVCMKRNAFFLYDLSDLFDGKDDPVSLLAYIAETMAV